MTSALDGLGTCTYARPSHFHRVISILLSSSSESSLTSFISIVSICSCSQKSLLVFLSSLPAQHIIDGFKSLSGSETQRRGIWILESTDHHYSMPPHLAQNRQSTQQYQLAVPRPPLYHVFLATAPSPLIFIYLLLSQQLLPWHQNTVDFGQNELNSIRLGLLELNLRCEGVFRTFRTT